MMLDKHMALISSESLLAHVIENVTDGMYFVDRDRLITFWSRGAAKLTGYSASDMLGTRGWSKIFDRSARELPIKRRQIQTPDEETAFKNGDNPLRRVIEDGIAHESQIFLHRRDGKMISVFSRLLPIRDAGGDIIGAVEIFSDNTPNLEMLEKLHELHDLAMQDPMTGLANRRLGEMTLQARLQEWNRYQWLFGVLFLDVDHFKLVNDQFGHAVGDEVLRGVADRLRTNLRTFDTPCRWGGDEFVVILGHVQEKQVQVVARKLLDLLNNVAFDTTESPVRLAFSIGGVVVSEGDSASRIIERADEKMYESKRKGGGCLTFDASLIE